MAIPDHEKGNPDPVAAEVGVKGGIEALPKRVDRYGKAKRTALDIANSIVEHAESNPGGKADALLKRADRLATCGDYLVFAHYYTVDEVRLHGARLCMQHLLCPLCAIRRGAKALKSYLDRWECIRVEKPLLRPFMVTLTVKDGPDLAERFKHLHKAQHELWKRRHRKRGSSLDGVEGAVWSYEFKRGKNSGLWHPHLHMIALAENMPDAVQLAAEWRNITGDSYIVDVRPISQEDPASGFVEVFKYAVKFSDQPKEDTIHAFEILKGKRLLASAGCFRGVKEPTNLGDETDDLEGLPYVRLFYRFHMAFTAYSLENNPPRSYAAQPHEQRLSRRRSPAGHRLGQCANAPP